MFMDMQEHQTRANRMPCILSVPPAPPILIHWYFLLLPRATAWAANFSLISLSPRAPVCRQSVSGSEEELRENRRGRVTRVQMPAMPTRPLFQFQGQMTGKGKWSCDWLLRCNWAPLLNCWHRLAARYITHCPAASSTSSIRCTPDNSIN